MRFETKDRILSTSIWETFYMQKKLLLTLSTVSTIICTERAMEYCYSHTLLFSLYFEIWIDMFKTLHICGNDYNETKQIWAHTYVSFIHCLNFCTHSHVTLFLLWVQKCFNIIHQSFLGADTKESGCCAFVNHGHTYMMHLLPHCMYTHIA